MRIMKVVDLSPGALSSFVQFVVELGKACRDKGADFLVVFPKLPPKDVKKFFDEAGVKVIARNMRGTFNLAFLVEMMRLIRHYKPDILHAQFAPACHKAIIAGKIMGVPRIYRTVQMLFVYRGTLRDKVSGMVNRLTTPFCTKVIFVSEEVGRAFCQFTGMDIPEDKRAVIYNPVCMERYSRKLSEEEKANLRRKLGVDEEDVVVGSLAQLIPRKGLHYLIKAAKLILGKRRDVTFLLVGKGFYEGKLKQMAKTLGIEDKVILPGAWDDVTEILPIFDIFCLPTLADALPFAIVEAMASGKPVVATRVGGCPEAVLDGETGFLVPPEDETALAEALLHLIEDEELRRKFGEAGRRRAEDIFSLKRCVEEYLKLYFGEG